MASPAPDAPMVDPTPRDLVSEKEQKPEVNGHATPVDSKHDTEKPTVNGDKDDHPVTNGVAKDVEMENSDAQSKPTNETTNETTNEDSSTAAKTEPSTESTQADESKPKTDEPAPTSEDVEMADVTPTEDKSVDIPATTTEAVNIPTTTAEEPAKDTEMSDKPKVNGTTEAPASSDDTSALPTSEVDLQPASLSQLAIETTETEASAKPSIEVTMEDAPTTAEVSSSTKIAREREDDATEERAPKRAKTESSEDEPTTTVIVASSAPAEASSQPLESPFTRLAKWDDSTFISQKITPHQRREIRKVLGRIKKTKQGGHFRDSVQKLWPGLWESYLAKIEKPTDLSEIDRTLRDHSGLYVTLAHFKKDLILMYDNTLAFNGPLHDVTRAAQGSIEAIWRDVITISPEEDPPKPKPAPKQKAPRESRTATHVEPAPVRKQSSGPGPSPVVEAPKPSPLVQSQPADVRRASTAIDGDRPKRTVRAPKPKDIDYTTKPSRKKLKPELQFSEEVLTEMMHPKNKHINGWFMEAVDAEGLGIPHYYSIIKKPMDLGKVSRLLASGDIISLKDFDKTVRLIFANCYAFNGSPDQLNPVSLLAKELEDFYNAQMKGKDSWLAKHAKANAPPPASHASDEEEEEEFEGEDVPAPSVDSSKEVREIEAKLREESEKLNDLFTADSPNQSLIMVQQGIVKMVQEALLAAKQKFSEYRQKHEKPGKKSSKPTKPKPSSSSAPRKPTGNAVPKKSGGAKKAATKKNLSAADKDQIANAINDLEYPHLDRAIDIIKRDTGQAENNDGELELDIDQLSNDALLKLWELCKKVLPGFGKDSTGPVSSPEVTRGGNAKQPKNAAKPKKNKPMSAREQEERIAQLRGLRDLYRPGQDSGDGQNVTQAPTPTAESSDDSDSEEE